ncbi:hypothetical protein uvFWCGRAMDCOMC449_012 [Freshwater phage uvFW-CGR-AMD-COM-C449]|jgi:hypothetical protein|nr:hypothetical protein uvFWCGRAMDCOMC449_012 [Freshwater phage uvFW-CGR-AMD-COM-C449]
MKHRETHPNLDVEGCFGCRVAGVRMGTNTTTSRGAKVAEINTTERNWNKDMPAYKRLRANGLQPKKIDGAANVEKRAQESWQVETGILPNI